MAIAHKVRLVEQLFDRVENEMNALKSETHINVALVVANVVLNPTSMLIQ